MSEGRNPARQETVGPMSGAEGAAAKGYVLVVDDSPTMLRLIRAHLTRAGWQVREASDGLDALRAAKASPPSVIVTDGLMPAMDGFLLCRAVRADPQLSATPVVIYSSIYSSESDAQLARTAGATALVAKTDNAAELPALLRRILAGEIEAAPLPHMDDLEFARGHLDRLVAVLLDQQVVLDRALESEREHARALVDLDRLRQSLINAVSHELRTPLTVVRGHASLLQRAHQPITPEQAQRHGQAIMESCNRLTTLLDDIMLVAHLEEDHNVLYTAPIALPIAIATAVTSVQGRYGPSQCPVEVECAEDLWVQANMRYLTHSVTHLIDNAVKHSPPGVPVYVGAMPSVEDPDFTTVVVRDHGPGLPEGDVDRLFEKFSKGADDAMRASRVGVGIGLYLVRTLTERMGGTVGAITMSAGGAQFSLRLRSATPPTTQDMAGSRT